jgi:hypothetical protein
MTLFLVIDDTGSERKLYSCFEHSNWHHIKILQKLLKHFQYDMFGGKHFYKEDLSIEQLIEIYKKNSNYGDSLEIIQDLKSLNLEENDIDGFVIIHFYNGWVDKQIQNIFCNISTLENDRDTIYNDFKNVIKEIGYFKK